MSTFAELMSSIGKPQAQAGTTANKARPTQPIRTTSGLIPNNAAAGVKRRSEEPSGAPQAKSVKTEQSTSTARPGAPTNRFQLTAKGSTGQKAAALPNRPSPKPTTSSSPQKPSVRPLPRPTSSSSPAPAANANGAPPAKRGYASIMAKAQAAQEAAKAAGPSGIKHKPVEKMSRRERARLLEEQKAQLKAGAKGGKVPPGAAGTLADRSRSGTPVGPGQKKKAAELSYKGTMKNSTAPAPREQLTYKGTMRKVDPAALREKEKKKRLTDDKYSGYVSWSDLDDAEDDEEEEGYESSDMEGGFDDVEREEMSALKAARREDQEALEEEERLKREKEERRKKLMVLSKSAAARKKY